MSCEELTPIVSVRDLKISFGSNKVLESVSFDLYAGETLGVIGPNGAGKTVLLNIISGILGADQGEILFKGTDISKKSVTERTMMGIGRTFQIPRSFERMTVYENALVGAVFGQNMSERSGEKKACEVLDMIGLREKKGFFAGKLGLLDRKRLEIGVALASDPSVLLLDEAAGGLTETEVTDLLEIIGKVKSTGIGVIWIEHVLQTMLHGTERILLLAEGRDLLCGSPLEVMESKEVERVYLGTGKIGAGRRARQKA